MKLIFILRVSAWKMCIDSSYYTQVNRSEVKFKMVPTLEWQLIIFIVALISGSCTHKNLGRRLSLQLPNYATREKFYHAQISRINILTCEHFFYCKNLFMQTTWQCISHPPIIKGAFPLVSEPEHHVGVYCFHVPCSRKFHSQRVLLQILKKTTPNGIKTKIRLGSIVWNLEISVLMIYYKTSWQIMTTG